ncbi:uncharacterized protein PHACADRAFT_261264 [Phanerochaete carnosa HHB-10118-sp]|uniref:NADP-dependent oxidoreductase domain-containing protein n=1 Tax=Phanerochaete carnosa (strain HHB-10118-sp) TaxID=650164 RepID=K5URZ8_PHACS|nr:uncharacterized protein PHACADRAFT_261264 [Phanerochaete carnosa HHB-10118-sp]EKM52676.1 hypothetical protein PHACADRAFT_261264 [Phanerochaete carnosa HHB-10118-sp]
MPATPSSKTRKIGNDDVTAIGYGAMGIAAFYGSIQPDEERLEMLDALYARGCTNWDTSNAYGDSEVLLSKWFKRTGKRDEIFLATKFGITGNPQRLVNGEPEYVKQCIEKSLDRLGVNCVDLYYLHRPDPTVPIEKTVGAMAELVQAGKVRYLGLSECTANDIRRAHAVHPISAIQVEYSLFEIDIESAQTGILSTARELGIAVVAYSPLGRGLLTGQYKSPDDFEPGDFRLTVPRFSKENFPRILELVDTVGAIGKKYNATPGQVALAWLLAQGDDIIPIPGTRKIKYLEENLGALDLKLADEDIQQIRKLCENVKLGDRYDSTRIKLVMQDTVPL